MNRRIRKKKDKKITEAINGLVSIAERREQQRQAAIRQSQGIKQLMAGGGVALIGTILVPLLSGLFG